MKKLLLSSCLIGLFSSLAAGQISAQTLTYLHARGSNIVDGSGNVVHLRGVNLGGWLVTEGWMCGQRDDGGRGAEEELEKRFGPDRTATLMNAWYDNWITPQDLDKIQAMGFNVIRVPFSYRNLQNETGGWILNSSGTIDFSRLDWIVEQAAERKIYVVLDFHFWPRQLEKGNYGLPSRWSNDGKIVRAQMAATWRQIALHFKGNSTIAGFDVINEPEGSPGDAPHHAFYRAIRSGDPDRMVILEWISYPGLATAGYTNIVWSPHYPEATIDKGTIDERLAAFDAKEKISSTPAVKVPIFVGETKAPDDTLQSATDLGEAYNRRGWSWAVWTYKGVNVGGWAAFDYTQQVSYNLSTDSYEAILHKWTRGLSQWHNSQLPANFWWNDWWLKGYQTAAVQ